MGLRATLAQKPKAVALLGANPNPAQPTFKLPSAPDPRDGGSDARCERS